MSNRTQILENIKDDAAAYIRTGKPMPERGLQWATAVADAIAYEKKQHELELVEKEAEKEKKGFARLDRLHAKLATANGLSYEEWLDKVKRHYIVDPETATVTSIASGPDHLKTWEYSSQLQAHRQVYKLMYWMTYNHFLRTGEYAITKKLRYDPDSKQSKT